MCFFNVSENWCFIIWLILYLYWILGKKDERDCCILFCIIGVVDLGVYRWVFGLWMMY